MMACKMLLGCFRWNFLYLTKVHGRLEWVIVVYSKLSINSSDSTYRRCGRQQQPSTTIPSFIIPIWLKLYSSYQKHFAEREKKNETQAFGAKSILQSATMYIMIEKRIEIVVYCDIRRIEYEIRIWSWCLCGDGGIPLMRLVTQHTHTHTIITRDSELRRGEVILSNLITNNRLLFISKCMPWHGCS